MNWLHASSPGQGREFAIALGRLALEEAATIPLGIFTSPSALRRDLSGPLPGSAPYFWGIRRT